jgi:hypothetical protein
VVCAVELWVTVAAVTARLVSGVVPPTAPVNVVVPVPPVIVKFWAPLSVLLKVTLALLEVTMLAPVKLTGLENTSGFAPDTVMLLPTWIKAALVKTKFVGAAAPPTTPLKLTLPPVPARKVIAVAPFNVPVKLMLAPAAVPPLFVLSNVGVFDTAVGPAIVITPPLVVTLPATLIAVDPV